MKCQKCGHKFHFNKTYNDNEISAIMMNEDENLKLLLKNIIRKIRNAIPSNDSKSSINNFISNAISYDYKIIEMAYKNYLSNAYMYQGKGFKYLLKIIDTFDKDSDKIFEYEKRRFGTSPPVIIWDGIMEETNGSEKEGN